MSTMLRRRMLMAGKGDSSTPNYLCFTALEPSTFSIQMAGNQPFTLEYSLDGNIWSAFNTSVTVPLATGDKAYLRGNNTAMAYNDSSYNTFVMTGKIEASGNIMSLLYASNFDNEKTISARYCFCRLFYNCTSLITPPELPATTLDNIGTYYRTFYGCTGLTYAPEIKATALRQNSCYQMFYGCTSLLTAPSLIATTVDSQSCYQMYKGCTALESMGDIYATTLAQQCFNGMFDGCSSLTSVGAIHATILANNCCNSMFARCSSLLSTPSFTIEATANNCCVSMFEDCPKLVTNNIKFNAANLSPYCYNRMFRLAPITTDVYLPATTLANTCYRQMLQGTKVTYIKMLATDVSASDCLTNWVLSVPEVSTSIFVKHINATWSTTGVNGVPNSWTVIYYNPTTDKYYLSDKTTECDDHGNPI